MPGPPHADPGKGVFETMLVLDGRPIELEAHLERLRGSLDLLFACAPPSSIRESILAEAGPLAHGRLRVAVTPSASGRAEVAISAAVIDPSSAYPPLDRGVALRTITVEGGLGAHKWVDRRLLERAEAEAPTAVPLLLDSDGVVLEAARGNVLAYRDGVLVTPPTDGRILPGIARRRAIEVAREEGIEVREEELRVADLVAAAEVLLTGSVGGVESIRSVDGVELAGGGEISERIAAGLRRRWARAPGSAAAPALAAARRSGPRVR